MLRGDTRALEQIIDLYGDSVYRLVARILGELGSTCDVEECCSDTFVSAWEQRAQYDPSRGSLRTWVLILARYNALDQRRKFQRRGTMGSIHAHDQDTLSTDEHTPEELLLRNETHEEVATALARLPVEDQKILYLRYFLDEPVEQIAAAMGISRGAADTRLWRARQLLKKLLIRDGKVVTLNV
jgi:RNA polymerase sigma-70 factor (ECF subfamily)